MMEIVNLVLHFDRYLGTAIGQYGPAIYLLLFAIVFCEIGFAPLFFLPGDPLIFICGAFCASGALNPWILVPLLIVATVLGSSVGFWIGRLLGHKVFSQHYRWLHKEGLERTRKFYDRFGSVVLIFSPFLAVIRTFAPLLAGVFDLQLARFMQFNVLGAVLWIGILIPGGYAFGNIPLVRDHLSSILLSGIALAAVAIALGTAMKIVGARSRPR
jgi:membrane-associated protein